VSLTFRFGDHVRLYPSANRSGDEHLLWTRDTRFAHRFAASAGGSRVLELDSGAVVIGPSRAVTDVRAAEVAREVSTNGYGLVPVDPALPEGDRYLMALSAAVQASGLAERIGMAQTTRLIQDRMLDYFFSLRKRHGVVFQPIVNLSDGTLHEYECLFPPDMPMRPQSISAIVQTAIDTERSVELDAFLITTTLDRVGELVEGGAFRVDPVLRLAINATPASLLDPRVEAGAFAARVRAAGIEPHQVTVECTEQQAVADVGPLQQAVAALRRAGFGLAVDDAGAARSSGRHRVPAGPWSAALPAVPSAARATPASP